MPNFPKLVLLQNLASRFHVASKALPGVTALLTWSSSFRVLLDVGDTVLALFPRASELQQQADVHEQTARTVSCTACTSQ